MSCERFQEKIDDALASGERALNGEIAAHLRTCGACREFYEKQRQLFGAINAGVQAMVNQGMPASLLPGVRARLEEAPAVRMIWRPAWLMPVAAAVVLAIGLAVMRHRGEQKVSLKQVQNLPSRESTAFVATPTTSGRDRQVGQKRQVAPRRGATLSLGPSEQTAEVIVLPDEREAFARFVARLPQEREATVGLTYRAPEQEDAPAEIALLRINGLEIEPLEPTEEK